MFRKKTVFILGAGASWHYGYPTGEDLVVEVRKKVKILSAHLNSARRYGEGCTPDFVRACFGPQTGPLEAKQYDDAKNCTDEFIRRLDAVDPLVIDYFLGQNPAVANVGRLLIAWVILDREDSYSPNENINRPREHRPNKKDNWCRFLVHRLASGCVQPADLIDQNLVTFVTFNYDVSLEQQLNAGLGAIELFAGTREKFLTLDRFLHIYGKIRKHGQARDLIDRKSIERGTLGFSTNDPNETKRLLFQKAHIDRAFHASKGIWTIDPADKDTETEVQQQAKQAIYEAEYIYILGFGFDSNNCGRLDLTTGLRGKTKQHRKRVMFTNLDDINRVNKSASRIFGVGDGLGPGKFLCSGTGDTFYEKSTRDCYGALAFDFDEQES